MNETNERKGRLVTGRPSSEGGPPQPGGAPPSGDETSTCPVLLEAEHVLALGQSFDKALHKLRRSMRRCQSCPSQGHCQPMLEFQQQINIAIAEITAEWNLF